MSARTIEVRAEVGLHARPAARFVKAVAASGAAVRIRRDGGEPVDAASILEVLGLGVGGGEKVVIESDDEDALDQLQALLQLEE